MIWGEFGRLLDRRDACGLLIKNDIIGDNNQLK